jgi:hypothetical protein
MNITIRTDVTPEVGEPKSVAVVFNSENLLNIVKTSGIEAGNRAIDGFVSKYTQDLKKVISEVINK